MTLILPPLCFLYYYYFIITHIYRHVLRNPDVTMRSSSPQPAFTAAVTRLMVIRRVNYLLIVVAEITPYIVAVDSGGNEGVEREGVRIR